MDSKLILKWILMNSEWILHDYKWILIDSKWIVAWILNGFWTDSKRISNGFSMDFKNPEGLERDSRWILEGF